MKTLLSALVLLLSIFNCFTKLVNQNDHLITLMRNAGYKSEAHEVMTADGYVLKIHRLYPTRKYEKSNVRKNPVFLMHGITGTPADFLLTGPDIAMAYMFADHGYDVWMGNSRGSRHSPKHKKYSPDSKEYWNFSWHEIGVYDLPAMIDYMLNHTKAEKSFFVGHSQAPATLLVMLSMLPQYNQKIDQAHFLAPAVYVANMKHPMIRVFKNAIHSGFFEPFNFLSFGPFYNMGKFTSSFTCRPEDATMESCQSELLTYFMMFGRNTRGLEMDPKIIGKLFHYTSPRSSAMQWAHYLQLIKSQKFRMYDHRSKNMLRYNTVSPPDYPLANVTAPVFLYHGANDLLLSPKDTEHLMKKLPNVKKYRLVNNYNHVDFVYGKNVRRGLYDDILNSFEMSRN